MKNSLFGALFGVACALRVVVPAMADGRDQICELSFGTANPQSLVYPHTVAFVYGPYVGGTQTGPAPTPTTQGNRYQRISLTGVSVIPGAFHLRFSLATW